MTGPSRRSIVIPALTWVAAAALAVSTLHIYITRPRADLARGMVDILRGKRLSEIAYTVFPNSPAARLAFKLCVRLSGDSRRVRAGEYVLEGDSIRSLARKMIAGKVLQYRVTVAEGAWAADIASLLDAAGIGRRARLMELIHDKAFVRRVTGAGAPSLEGFLFPETYFFSKGMREEDVLSEFVARFNQLGRPVLASSSLPLLESLTIASIVEREAAAPDERPLIAAVFLNRLKKNMPLASCVTVEYAMGRKKARLLDADLEIESPYNTYRHAGLPPGPISNPGAASMRAVAEPASTDYLYFVASGGGRHIFSMTGSEHIRAKKNVRKRR